ncbi:hypothetical protein ABZ235_36575 [Streptomyces canus]|uniref:hypothetical protein n=1 Tax=Streptomyces canus TaxID=58343 RepID=UPI0033B650D3
MSQFDQEISRPRRRGCSNGQSAVPLRRQFVEGLTLPAHQLVHTREEISPSAAHLPSSRTGRARTDPHI